MGVSRLKMASLGLSAVMLATSFTPSMAFPQIPTPVKVEQAGDVETVQYYRRRDYDERWRDRDGYRREYRRDYRRDNYSYYRGHRGYRYYRPGYREYNGYWFPLAAFATGALIGGAVIDNEQLPVGEALPAEALDGFRQSGRGIVDREDNADQTGHGNQ